MPAQRDQSNESRDVGQDAGRYEQCACDEDDHAVEQFLAWQIASLKALIEAPPDRQSFSFSQIRAGNAGDDDDCDRRPESDPVSQPDQQGELDDWCDEKKRE